MAITVTGLTNKHLLTSTSAATAADDGELNISLLYNFKSHLHKTGKVCPKPWFWGRFYMEFQPMYESYWLAQWWQTSDADKRARFMEQLDYLAHETSQFRAGNRRAILPVTSARWLFRTRLYLRPSEVTDPFRAR